MFSDGSILHNLTHEEIMIKIAFTEEDIKALKYERYHHPHPRVQRKIEALWLKSQGEPHNKIAQLTGSQLMLLPSISKNMRLEV